MIKRHRALTLISCLLSTVILLSEFVIGHQPPINPLPYNDEFVKRDGVRLTLGGETFRFGGPNIEWLGLEAYGPLDSMGPRYPSHFEVDDAMDTAKAMGARVIRSQTLGDSIGCPKCIEPKVGEFNPEAFQHIDYAIKAAHDRGLRLIFTLVGDCANCDAGGAGEYSEDKGPAH